MNEKISGLSLNAQDEEPKDFIKKRNVLRTSVAGVLLSSLIGGGSYLANKHFYRTSPSLAENEQQIENSAKNMGWNIAFYKQDPSEGINPDGKAAVFTVKDGNCIIPDVEARVDSSLYTYDVGIIDTNQEQGLKVQGIGNDWQIEPFSPVAKYFSSTYKNFNYVNFLPISEKYILHPNEFKTSLDTCSTQSSQFRHFVKDNPQHVSEWSTDPTIFIFDQNINIFGDISGEPVTNGQMMQKFNDVSFAPTYFRG